RHTRFSRDWSSDVCSSDLIDLAVNVRLQQTPVWLINAIVSTGNWAHYPDPSAARNALAAMHQVPRQMVLPTSGGAEGFTLIAHRTEERRVGMWCVAQR